MPPRQVAWRGASSGAGLGLNQDGQGRTVKRGEPSRCTAGFVQPDQIGLHALVLSQNGECFAKDFCGAGGGRYNDPIVHPLAFAPGCDNAGAAQIRQVPRDLWLALAENLDEVADTNLSAIHEVQEPQARGVGQGREEEGQIAGFRGMVHVFIIYALTDMSSGEYIRFNEYKESETWHRPAQFGSR
jgi:hypothetical protein